MTSTWPGTTFTSLSVSVCQVILVTYVKYVGVEWELDVHQGLARSAVWQLAPNTLPGVLTAGGAGVVRLGGGQRHGGQQGGTGQQQGVGGQSYHGHRHQHDKLHQLSASPSAVF